MIKNEFIQFLHKNHVIRHGEFTLKNGRSSEVYYDFGSISTGADLRLLGRFYATWIMTNLRRNPPDLLLGAANKGIGISIATSMALEDFGLCIPYAFDRPNAKPYGDERLFVGHDPGKCNRILILDDVFTDGLTKTLLISKIPGHIGRVLGILVGIDRMDIHKTYDITAREVFQNRIGLTVWSLANREEIP